MSLVTSMIRLVRLLLVPTAVLCQNRNELIASQCCPEKTACCLEAIRIEARLSNCYMNIEEEKEAADCVQKGLFTVKSHLYASFSDIECCSIFDRDENDIGGLCRSKCVESFSIPSLTSTTKLHIVRNCRQDADRDMYKCFRSCQNWLRASPNGTFPIRTKCNGAAMLHEKKLYLAEELPLDQHKKTL